MEIASIFEDITYGEKHPAVKLLMDTVYVKELRLIFRKGQEMKEHKTGAPIVVMVMEGCINFGIAAERHILKKGMMIAVGPDVIHDLQATEESIVRLSIHKLA